MVTIAVIELGFVALGLVLSWLHVMWLKKKGDKKNHYDEVIELFNLEWNGEESDEVYAWYRVRWVINSQNPINTKKLEIIDGQLRKLGTHSMRSKSFIGENGKLYGSVLERDEW